MHFHVSAATGKQNGGRNNDKSASLLKELINKGWFVETTLMTTGVICGGQRPDLLNILEWSLLQSEYLTSH